MFDASALLCFLQGEQGSDLVEGALDSGGACPAVNWSEVAQKVLARGGDWDLAGQLLHSFGLTVEPVIAADAESAARAWRAGDGLSLADRLCLAVGERLHAVVWTADSAWGSAGRVRQVR